MGSIRAIPRVGSATTSAVRGAGGVGVGAAASAIRGGSVSSGGSVTGASTQGASGARVGAPAVAFSSVMEVKGGGAVEPGGVTMGRALELHIEARTLESQQLLAQQKQVDLQRASEELKERVHGAVEDGALVRVRHRKLHPRSHALPPHVPAAEDPPA